VAASAKAVQTADKSKGADSAAERAKQAVKNPAMDAPDEPISPVQKCPIRVQPKRLPHHRKDLDEKWYDKETGELIWPDGEPDNPISPDTLPDGFDEPPVDEVIEEGFLDRYGSASGSFLSTPDTPFEKRALPYDPGMEHHYYRVKKPLHVKAGKVRPWFDQEGGGMQYKTDKSVADLSDCLEPVSEEEYLLEKSKAKR
jgi:hypothetical protein